MLWPAPSNGSAQMDIVDLPPDNLQVLISLKFGSPAGECPSRANETRAPGAGGTNGNPGPLI